MEWLLATMQKETSFTLKVLILIHKSGNQDMKHNAKSGKSSTPKRKSVLWHTRSRRLKQRWRMLLQLQQATIFRDQVRPALAAHGVQILDWESLTAEERTEMDAFFDQRVFPVLTPLAVDPSHPFPYISGLSLNLAVVVRNPVTGTELFARVKVPPSLPRFVRVDSQRFVPLEDVIAAHLDDLFPGMDILQHHSFRVTRNEDVEVEEDDAENLLKALERELTRRRFGPADSRYSIEFPRLPHTSS